MAINSNTNSPALTHTLTEFINIEQQLPNKSHYGQFSFKEVINGEEYIVANIIDDYLYELKQNSTLVNLNSKEINEYKYNPKKLAYKLYKSTDLYWVILKMNDIPDVHEFDLKKGKLYLANSKSLRSMLDSIYNAEKFALASYNSSHDNLEQEETVEKYK